MIGIYFSGTGNTRYCVETFMRKYKDNAETYSIEDDNIERYILKSHEIVLVILYNIVRYQSMLKILLIIMLIYGKANIFL